MPVGSITFQDQSETVGSNPTISAKKVLVSELFRFSISTVCPQLPNFCPRFHRLKSK
jgi:hypothetical protein